MIIMIYNVSTNFGNGNKQALQIIQELRNLEVHPEEEVIIDFRSYGENNPFSNLVIANTIRQFKQEHVNHMQMYPHSNTYLAHLGFYHMIGADYGKALGEAQPSRNYVPIRKIEFSGDFYQTIDKNAYDLAGLLYFDKDLQGFLQFIFIETIRNVYEHSGDQSVYVTAQKWPSFDLLEIAIADSGCGIAQSMKRRFPKYDDKKLMYLSCQPGISACSNYAYLERDDGWRNSGYGLYMLRKLAVAYGGSFLICSDKTALWQTSEGVKEIDTDYHGTALAIRIKTNTGLDFAKTRDTIVREGEAKAKQLRGAIQKASRSSGGRYF